MPVYTPYFTVPMPIPDSDEGIWGTRNNQTHIAWESMFRHNPSNFLSIFSGANGFVNTSLYLSGGSTGTSNWELRHPINNSGLMFMYNSYEHARLVPSGMLMISGLKTFNGQAMTFLGHDGVNGWSMSQFGDLSDISSNRTFSTKYAYIRAKVDYFIFPFIKNHPSRGRVYAISTNDQIIMLPLSILKMYYHALIILFNAGNVPIKITGSIFNGLH